MTIIDAYLRLVSRWRWSFLLALLIGAFVLQAILPNGTVTRLTGFTLFMLVFGGAPLRRAHRPPGDPGGGGAAAGGGRCSRSSTSSASPRSRGRSRSSPLAIVLGALVATFAELVGNRDATADSLVGAIFGYFVIAAACALLFRQMEGIASRLVPPARGRRRPRHADALFQPDHRDHRRLRRHHARHPDRADLRRRSRRRSARSTSRS